MKRFLIGSIVATGAATLLVGSLMAQAPGMAPKELALKVLAAETAKQTDAVNASLAAIEKGCQTLNMATDKIKSKADTKPIDDARKQVIAIKADVTKLDAQVNSLRGIGKKLEAEMKAVGSKK